MASYVDDAAAVGSDLVAFPEICNTLGAADCWQFEQMDGPTITAMSIKAKEKGIYVVCPLGIYDEEGKKRNSAVLLDRGGKIAGVYHKNFPTHGELDLNIIPGTEAPVFETDFGRVGLSICFDINYWEVGSELCKNKAELVIWSSMWDGARMLTKWAIEFGFYMGAVFTNRGTFVDVCGRELLNVHRKISDSTGRSPVVTGTLDLDRRLLHHDYNVEKLEKLYKTYGPTAAFTEWRPDECLLIFGSELPGKSSDDLITEFDLETMRDYLARARKNRQKAIEGSYL